MILDRIAEDTRQRVMDAKLNISLEDLQDLIKDRKEQKKIPRKEAFAFEKALRNSKISFICEVKKASPSKGIISPDFPYLQIALEYQAAGANAISVLTEPKYFQGSNEYLQEISKTVSIPVLRKDFTVDEYQLYEAKLIGADAVLLICSLLNTQHLKQYITICNELGLSALVEAHTEEEVFSAIEAGARIIGVNNRNLKTFEVDLNHCIRLRDLVPKDIIFVAESGIHTAEDMRKLSEAGVDAVLIGESFMRSTNKKEMMMELRKGI